MIEAFTICVDHADFLAFTMPMNIRHFDKWIVITSHTDEDTKKVCRFYGVQYIETDVMNIHKGQFLKGKGVNLALENLSKSDWIIQIDADCALPPSFSTWMKSIRLNRNFIYGMDRIMFEGCADWFEFLANPTLQLDGHFFPFQDIGGRLSRYSTDGYVVCGYFQMWNIKSGITRYPETWAGHFGEDVVFSSFWPRRRRSLLPEMVIYHLATEPGQGNNWKGRKTPHFLSQIDRGGYVNSGINPNNNRSLVRREKNPRSCPNCNRRG